MSCEVLDGNKIDGILFGDVEQAQEARSATHGFRKRSHLQHVPFMVAVERPQRRPCTARPWNDRLYA